MKISKILFEVAGFLTIIFLPYSVGIFVGGSCHSFILAWALGFFSISFVSLMTFILVIGIFVLHLAFTEIYEYIEEKIIRTMKKRYYERKRNENASMER